MLVVGDHVRKISGRADLGREGVVTAILGSLAGDTLVEVDAEWQAYDRQLEKVQPTPS